MAKKKAEPVDPGLQEIDNWHRWFTDGHRARIAADNLPPDQAAIELENCLAIGDEVAARMRAGHIERQRGDQAIAQERAAQEAHRG